MDQERTQDLKVLQALNILRVNLLLLPLLGRLILRLLFWHPCRSPTVTPLLLFTKCHFGISAYINRAWRKNRAEQYWQCPRGPPNRCVSTCPSDRPSTRELQRRGISLSLGLRESTTGSHRRRKGQGKSDRSRRRGESTPPDWKTFSASHRLDNPFFIDVPGVAVMLNRQDLLEEPYAVVPHVRICAGGGQ